MFKMFTRVFAKPIVEAAYRAILGRDPDPEGLASHVQSLKRHGSIQKLLSGMSGSVEAWNHTLYAQPELLARVVSAGFGKETPSSEEVAAVSSELAQNKDLAEVLRRFRAEAPVGRSFDRQSAALAVVGCFKALLGREPEPEALSAYSALLEDTQDLGVVVDDICRSAEHAQFMSRQSAKTSVDAIFQGLLDRPADPVALEAYGESLAQVGDLAAVVADVGRSEEHARVLIRKRPEVYVQLVFQGLLQRDPEPEAQEAYSRMLAETGDLASLMNDVAGSREHRAKVLRRGMAK